MLLQLRLLLLKHGEHSVAAGKLGLLLALFAVKTGHLSARGILALGVAAHAVHNGSQLLVLGRKLGLYLLDTGLMLLNAALQG